MPVRDLPKSLSRFTEIRSVEQKPSVLQLVNTGGGQAIQSIINIIPMLLVSLAVVIGLQKVGFVAWLSASLHYPLFLMGVNDAYILPFITKYLAGGTAMVSLFTRWRSSQVLILS
ncbi:hypothetical protein I3J13_25480 [Agrobacterium sp. MOPV5]|nr:hypothetical protein [Agrobacterium leguminum]